MRGFFVRLDTAIAAVVRWVIIVMMAAMTILVFLQVLSRYLFNTPLGWSEEVARFAFVWLSFLGAAILIRTDGHIRVTLLVDALPNAGWIMARALQYAGALLCIGIFVVGGLGLTKKEWSQIAPATDLPMGYVYVVIPAAAILMLVWTFAALCRDLAGGRRRPVAAVDVPDSPDGMP
ncbi:MAG: TRAP transporter small permease [Betaproteobacteria bacterium]